MYRTIRKLSILSIFCLCVWVSVQFFLPIALPFLLGTVLALAAEPVVSLLHRRLGLPRSISAGVGVTAAFCLLAMVLILLGAVMVRELGLLAAMLPDLESTARSGMEQVAQWALALVSRLPLGLGNVLSRNITDFFSGSSRMLDEVFRYAMNLAGGMLRQVPGSAMVLGTAIISSFMISAKLPRLRDWFRRLLLKERLQPLWEALKAMKTALFGWLKAQLKLMMVTWVILTLAFVLLRIPFAPLWAALTALVDAFPVLGTGTVLLPWSLVCFLQSDTGRAIGLLGSYAAVSLTRSLLEPKLVGQHLGLDPLATLVALYAGYKLFGLAGMLLAPMLAVAALQLVRIKKPKLSQS